MAHGENITSCAAALMEESVTDSFLLGEDFGKKLKTTKASEKAGKEMLQKVRNQPYEKTTPFKYS